ncbi:RNA-binding domain-containing protein [uncultured Thiodictyon sp.]|uniref:RNA-binding domain-containing protein n=1 Tax=uncultured Thiodictyon sp. TaxID=1846217 RepID=UPI0026007C6F|nr:RNA-binding domain-containing protein [uncultured Thiodictyon sp.]
MKSYLPIGIEELLGGAVETARLEFKATWDPAVTGHQIIKTLCAFANDLQNLNGGYVVLGVAEQGGIAVRPIVGLDSAAIDGVQRQIRENCNRIEPAYMPVMDVCELDGRQVLVLWAPASDVRPHQAPDGAKGEKKYWVRIGSQSVEAKNEILTALLQQTARVPFDDRRAHAARNDDLSLSLVREFLNDVRSDLRDDQDAEHTYRAMQIVSRVNGHSVPRNVALLFFSHNPEQWFRGARIEVVEFPDEAGGNTLTEKVFRGPLHHQLRQCLTHLESLTTRHLEKSSAGLETHGWLSFPVPALREALVSAVYHRGYETCVEPTKVYLYPNRIEIISYPGPVQGIEQQHLAGTVAPPPVPARNRRIGEFLEELRLAEGRGTGLPKIRRSMAENGSPAPVFDFDEGRTYFRITLPAHPQYVAPGVLRDYAYKKATGDQSQARALLERAWHDGMRSPSIAVALVREKAEQGDLAGAEIMLAQLDAPELATFARALTALAAAYADARDEKKSKALLNRLPAILAAQDAFDAAILERRLGRQDRAHRLFERAGELVLRDARALHEFAQTKLSLTAPLAGSPRPADQQTRNRLLHEALAALKRVIQMDAPPTRHAWAWFNLGQARQWLRAPRQDVIAAYEQAVALIPDERRFQQALAQAGDDV